ncbi:MAG: hypothetical protein ACMUJM_08345 [bacterium]
MKNNRLIRKNSVIVVITLVVSLLCISQAGAQFFYSPPVPYAFGAPLLFPLLSPVRVAAIPLANVTPVTVTVPQVTAAGLTITSLIPGLAAPTPTLSVIVNVTAATFPLLPTTFVAPFPLTAAVIPTLPAVTTTVTLPAATPTLTSIIALGLGGGIPGLGGGTTIVTALPAPVPTTTLPVVAIPTAAAPITVPII